MKLVFKVGKTDGIVSSYNLFVGSLRLRTEDLCFKSKDEKHEILGNFIEFITLLKSKGIEIEMEVEK